MRSARIDNLLRAAGLDQKWKWNMDILATLTPLKRRQNVGW